MESELDHSYFARALSAFKAYCVVLKHANSSFNHLCLSVVNDKLKETVLRFANGAKNGEVILVHSYHTLDHDGSVSLRIILCSPLLRFGLL